MWRDKDPKDAPKNIDPVIRIKAPIKGESVINDIIQGTIKVSNEEIDDFIIMRSDGTPTYMLSVVVDDYDMKISHVIRGNDHLTNTFRQMQILNALKWKKPIYVHEKGYKQSIDISLDVTNQILKNDYSGSTYFS